MKKIAISIVVVLGGIANISQSIANENNWYVGTKLGWSNYHHKIYYSNNDQDNNNSYYSSKFGTGAFGGYQLNQHLGFEFGYDWLGRMPTTHNKNSNNNLNSTLKAQGIELTGKFSYPIITDLDIYTRLGAMIWKLDSTQNVYSNNISQHATGVSPLATIGIEYAVTKNWTTRLDYQWMNNISNRAIIGKHLDNSMLSLGVAYHFGQKITPTFIYHKPYTFIKPKHFVIKSDVLFNFNKHLLKIEGRRALDHLYSQIKNLKTKNGSIIILGYTDCIGSKIYNQKLSEKRAKSVANYLIYKGVPANNIYVHGNGQSKSITGNNCYVKRNKNDLIKCLAPDRRVEIEVKGIKEIKIFKEKK